MKATLTYATLALLVGTTTAFSKTKPGTEASRATDSHKEAVVKSGGYTVQAGDTLERIARKLDCSAAALGKANKITTETIIHPGQTLKVPGGSKAEPAPETSRVAEKSASRDSGKTASAGNAKAAEKSTPKTATAKAAPKEEKEAPKTASNKPKKPESTEEKPKEKEKEKLASNNKPEPKPEAKSPASSGNSSDSKMISNPKPAATASSPAFKPADSMAEASKAPAAGGGLKSGVRSVIIQDETSYGTFASAHGTTSDRLNDLNGLSLSNNTVLAKGSELYIPAQP